MLLFWHYCWRKSPLQDSEPSGVPLAYAHGRHNIIAEPFLSDEVYKHDILFIIVGVQCIMKLCFMFMIVL